MLEKRDNTTKYGEEVCSEFAWLPLDKQKENAEKFAEITKKKDNKKKISNMKLTAKYIDKEIK